MDTKKSDLLEALAKIPGLDDLSIPIEDLPSREELKQMTDALMAVVDKELAIMAPAFEASLAGVAVTALDDEQCVRAPSVSENAPPTCALRSGKSKPVTIRMPIWLLEAYRNKAADAGGAYQTLIIKTLKAAARQWQSPI